MTTEATRADTGPATRQGLALIAAAARDDELGLGLLLGDLRTDDAKPVIRFLANFAASFVVDNARRSCATDEQLGDILSGLISESLTSSEGVC